MGYDPLVDFHPFSLTKRFPIIPSTIQPIGTPSTFCLDKTVSGFLDVKPFQLLDVAIFVVQQFNFAQVQTIAIIAKKLLRIFLKFQTKFDKDAVRDIIRYAIKENVGTSQQYDAKLITRWSNKLMEDCLVAPCGDQFGIILKVS